MLEKNKKKAFTLLRLKLQGVNPRPVVPGYIVFPDPSFSFCGSWSNAV
jgi:hypothetical protein